MWQQYGDIYRCYFGPFLTVVVNDVPGIKALLADERTSDRPDLFLFRATDNNKGLGLSNGHVWRTQRRFALSTLRDLGMGKTFLQDTILDQVTEVLKIFSDTNGKPFNPKILFGQSLANVICSVTFGQRFEHNDKHFLRLMELFAENNILAGFNRPLQIFPILRLIPFSKFRRDYLALMRNINELHEFIGVLIKKHGIKETSDGVRDYVTAFLQTQELEKNNPNSTFDDEQLVISVRTLFGAGTDTTAGTLCWCLLYMIEHPEVQRKVQEEIDQLLGNSQLVTMEHKVNLPYTEATIMEVQRNSPAVPATGRGVTDDIIHDGYLIPKGSHIAVNMYGVHHDARYFPQPETFRPERFIDEKGRIFRPDAFMPFASGKRMCLGESLARMELFLFFSNILKHFDVRAAPDCHISPNDVIFGQVNVPGRFELAITPRRL
ncbi:cytochrome P450 2C15-like isoform X2 [Paramacrobiotus metropolitanus]|nr:cytochrome P450 2C15-like isoform X2 [Paramacrobiotus metropolitanus]